jgi:Sad1 / UNC-like C-terminal
MGSPRHDGDVLSHPKRYVPLIPASSYSLMAAVSPCSPADELLMDSTAVPSPMSSALTPAVQSRASSRTRSPISPAFSSTVVSPDNAPSSAAIESGIDTDTQTTDGGFLSFEDWKRLNLMRASDVETESEEAPHASRSGREAPHPRAQYGDQSIDSISDEIDIQMSPSTYGHTSKERFNYASFDCAAAILKANPEAKGSSSILDENKDRYLLNKCGASNKFVIVELCDDILVDTIVLANLEFFSSTFKEFRVSVSDRYPIQEREWRILGTFVANNMRRLQVFAIENPLIWARFLRIEFLAHYGNEFYCPVTLLRVHGTTMMEEYKNQESSKHGNHDSPRRPMVPSSSDSGASESPSAKKSTTTAITQSSDSRNPSADAQFGVHCTPSLSNVVSGTGIEASVQPDCSDSSDALRRKTEDECLIEQLYDSRLIDEAFTTPLSVRNTNVSDLTSSTSQTENHDLSEPAAYGSETVQTLVEKEQEPITGYTNPTSQESVYKTITKRLNLLEANATLSLRYIEAQSRLLRDVFGKMERRHGQKIDSFLSELNSTLASGMQFFVTPDVMFTDLESGNSTSNFGIPRL